MCPTLSKMAQASQFLRNLFCLTVLMGGILYPLPPLITLMHYSRCWFHFSFAICKTGLLGSLCQVLEWKTRIFWRTMSIRARTEDSQYYTCTVDNRRFYLLSTRDHSYKVHLAVDVSYKGSNTWPFSSLLVSKDVALFESNYHLSWYFLCFIEENVGISFVWFQ